MSATTREEIEGQLRTLGVTETPSSIEIALDRTITPETFAARFDEPARAVESVGPLPRISLSGIDAGPQERAPRAEPRPDHGTADLEILSVLGEGGMGRVHLARQRSLGRDVAIKTLKHEVADARAVEMLRAEATTMGRLEHPNVVPVHAVGLDDHGRLLLVMKRIDGVAWRDLMDDPQHPRWQTLAPLEEQRLDFHLDVLGQVANALHFGHGRGIVHRDVKPDNVLLGEHGEVYLADWGVALRVGREPRSELVGTPLYMAPEMAMGDSSRIDARTDVFLLGATLHEILTGAPPHRGGSLHAVLLAVLEGAPPVYGDDVPRELASIAARAMAREPSARFESALAFRHALDTLRRHRGSIALTRSAQALLEDLSVVPARATPDETKRTDIDRKLTECRFAFVQALRDWPENSDARAGLDACLLRAIRHELARENAEAARGLLEELSVPNAALAAEILALETRLASRRAEAARLAALEADADIGVGHGARTVVFGMLGVLAIALTAAVLLRTGGDATDLEIRDVVGIGGGLFGILGVAVILLRKRLLANAVGRRVTALLLLSTAALFLHRLVGAAFGVPVPALLAMDTIVLGTSAAAAGIIVPRAAWAALPPVLGAMAAVAMPTQVALVFSLVTVATIALVIALWLSELRARTRGQPQRPETKQ